MDSQQPKLEVTTFAYAEARKLIRDGDLLLWQPTNLFGRRIAARTHGPYSHVGSASWCGDVLESHDMLQWRGGQTTNLSCFVRQYPGKIHVWRARNLRTREAHNFSQRQRRRAGEQYGWRDLWWNANKVIGDDDLIGPRHVRLQEVDRGFTPKLWDALYIVPVDKPAFCSEGVVSDLRAVGLEVFTVLAAWEISPNDLTHIADFRFALA
jgi:hypothetical protein